MNVEPLLAPFEACYPRFEIVRPRLAPRIRCAAFFKLKRFRYVRALYIYLKDHPDEWRKLGFRELPTYELLREFLNEILPKVLEELNDRTLVEASKEARSLGMEIFKEVSEDAVDIKARKADKEAEWSSYYEEYGYKADLAVCLQTGMIATPIFLGINEHEGHCFPKQAERLIQLGFKPESWGFDGKYSSKGSIAIGEIGYGMRLNYKILDAWVIDPRGSEEEIMRAYQKHWRDDCFQPDAGIRSALGFFYKLGDLERVGAWCRNRAMERFREDPDAYLKEYHKRSKSESTNSHLKEKLDLERGVPKGAAKAERHVLLCVLARNMVALTRLQHGVTENLTSVAYLS
jgi:hypothetical protein